MQARIDEDPLTLSYGKGRTRLRFRLHRAGRDLVGILTGGEGHIGASALAWPGRKGWVRAKALSVPQHREAEVASTLAATICQATRRTCLVVAGIHLNQIRRAEIRAILCNARRLQQRLERLLRAVKE